MPLLRAYEICFRSIFLCTSYYSASQLLNDRPLWSRPFVKSFCILIPLPLLLFFFCSRIFVSALFRLPDPRLTLGNILGKLLLCRSFRLFCRKELGQWSVQHNIDNHYRLRTLSLSWCLSFRRISSSTTKKGKIS